MDLTCCTNGDSAAGVSARWSLRFLVGGDYTAYTFTATQPSLSAKGAVAFFAVPYTIVIIRSCSWFLPRLWNVCRKHGYITRSCARSLGNRWLALAPSPDRRDHALQPCNWWVSRSWWVRLGMAGNGIADPPLIIAFLVLAAFTYLRADC